MLRLLTFVFVLLGFGAVSQDFGWSIHMGGENSAAGVRNMAVDRWGNTYTTGAFWGTYRPDSTSTPFNVGAPNHAFIQKNDPQGGLIWVKKIGAPGQALGEAIATDAQGNVYVAGFFIDSVDVDPGQGETIFTAVGGTQNGYMIKLDPNGDLLWGRHFEGFVLIPSDILIDHAGNVVITGDLVGEVDMNPGAGSHILTSAGGSDILIAKLNSAGEMMWAERYGGLSQDVTLDLDIDKDNNIYVTGYYHYGVNFDPDDPMNEGLLLAGGEPRDMYLVRFSSSGEMDWAYSPPGEEVGTGLAVDDLGYLYVSAVNYSYITSIPEITIYKFKAEDREKQWHVWVDGEGGEYATDLSVADHGGTIAVSGWYQETLELEDSTLSTYSNVAGFVFTLDSLRHLEWMHTMADQLSGTVLSDYPAHVAFGPGASVHLAGNFKHPFDFDPTSGENEMSPYGISDAFVVKLGCGATFSQVQVNGCNQYTGPSGRHTWNTDGTYFDTLMNHNGCDSIITIQLTLTPFQVTVTKTDSSLRINEVADSYKWVSCADLNNVLTTNAEYFPSGSGFFQAIYQKGDCIDTSDCIYFPPLGVDELDTPHLLLYPNPATDELRVEWFSRSSAPASITLRDVLGRVVFSRALTPQERSKRQLTINTQSYDRGWYSLEIQAATRVHSQRVILK